jgi:glycosyltransferase involved in cell wall biosynthesis
MRILLSAYACGPYSGSEGGVSWNWSTQLAQRHEVVVLTDERCRRDIEKELARNPRDRLRFVFYEFRPIRRIPFNGYTAVPKYVLWQLAILPLALRLNRQWRFDLVHHLTYGTFRYPSWLGFLGPPFVVGPVGGGERAPLRLFRGLPLSERAFEWIRIALIVSGRFDPLLRLSLRRADLVLARTRQTLLALPRAVRDRAVVHHEIGCEPGLEAPAVCRRDDGAPLRVLMVCRLLGWKGVHLALEAASLLQARSVPVQVDVCGSGRLMPWLRDQVERRGLREHFRLLGQVGKEEMRQKYRGAHLLLFPSLHDSGGTAVLEAFCCSLPVLCLDLGGPGEIVNDSCGLLVPTAGRSRAEIADGLAGGIARLAADENLRQALARGAAARARDFAWGTLVREVEARMERLALGGRRPPAVP